MLYVEMMLILFLNTITKSQGKPLRDVRQLIPEIIKYTKNNTG